VATTEFLRICLTELFGIRTRLASSCLALVAAISTGCSDPPAASPLEVRTVEAERGIEQPVPAEPSAPAAAESVESGSDHNAPAVEPAQFAAEPATPPPPQRPPADRAPTKPGDAEKITWEDVNLGMQADVVFRPFMTDNHRVKDLEGKRISIIGYMHGGQAGQRGIKEFILLKNTQCKFGPGGQADHLADVKLKPDSGIPYTPSPVKVEGTLVIDPFQGPDGNTWSIYRLESAQIR
jgi:hypothetical protein